VTRRWSTRYCSVRMTAQGSAGRARPRCRSRSWR